jgi:hypothetical protein
MAGGRARQGRRCRLLTESHSDIALSTGEALWKACCTAARDVVPTAPLLASSSGTMTQTRTCQAAGRWHGCLMSPGFLAPCARPCAALRSAVLCRRVWAAARASAVVYGLQLGPSSLPTCRLCSVPTRVTVAPGSPAPSSALAMLELKAAASFCIADVCASRAAYEERTTIVLCGAAADCSCRPPEEASLPPQHA